MATDDTSPDCDLLRFSTSGSVDDGKSTLVGRLLHDTHSIFDDQFEAIELASRQRGERTVNLSLLTDGLRAEREQGITIDVAYRYFATSKRRFIVADSPGHAQYTRNMVTGSSTAELTIVLVDARKGVLTQSRRHGFIASLLRIPHTVVAVNKMDLVDYSEDVFSRIVSDYRDFASTLSLESLVFIPISALDGDNIVHHGARMPWYEGTTLLHHLETVNVGAHRNLVDFRFPVQSVIRPHQDFRGFSGRISSGRIAVGDEVVVLPSGTAARVATVHGPTTEATEAFEGDSVVLTLDHEVDVSRGDMLVRAMNLPVIGNRIDVMMCWMSDSPMDSTVPYRVMHTTRATRVVASHTVYRVDVDTLHRETVNTLELNDIGRVELTVADPLFFDAYGRNRATGSLILVDPITNLTVAAGMIRGPVQTAATVFGAHDEVVARPVSRDVVWDEWNIPRAEREARNGHDSAIVWFTGLSGAGKSTIARALERTLHARGCQTMLLDGDQLRHGLNGDLDFSPAGRRENIRRAAETARLFFEQGCIVLCAFVSPYRADRRFARSLVPDGRFLEVFVDCDLAECERRDPKGLYRGARSGHVAEFTGLTSPYEAPESAESYVNSAVVPPEDAVRQLVRLLEERVLTKRGLMQ